MPLLSVLSAGETSNATNLADLIVDFIDIGVLLQAFNGFDVREFTHDDHPLKQEVDQAFLQVRVVVLDGLLDQGDWLNEVDWVLAPL